MTDCQTFNLQEFLARSSDVSLEDTMLGKVISALPSVTPKGPWIAGGAIRRTLLGKNPESDFDFFFRDAAQLEAFGNAMDERGFTRGIETDHVVNFSGQVDGEDVLVQAIKFQFYASPAEVIDSFDFTICQFVFDGKHLHCGPYALWDLGRKRLAVNKITFGLSSMRRCLKYQSQGFTVCSGALTQLLRAVADNPRLIRSDIQYVD